MLNNSRTTHKIAQSLALATLTTPFLAACGSNSDGAADNTITFAAILAESSQSLRPDYDNLVKLIAKETGREVEFQDTSDYAAAAEGQRAGKIGIASHGLFSHAIIRDSDAPIEVVVSPINDESRAPACTSLAYVKEGLNIESPEDLKGKRACFVDSTSTSGYLVLTKGLMDEELKPDGGLEPVMAGGHDVSLFTFNDGGYDVTFAHDVMLKTPERSSQIKPGVLKSIWEFEPITEDLVAPNTETIPAEDLTKIKTVLSDKANKPALIKEEICSSGEDYTLPEEIEWGYLPVIDTDFNSIRRIYGTTKADACSAVSQAQHYKDCPHAHSTPSPL